MSINIFIFIPKYSEKNVVQSVKLKLEIYLKINNYIGNRDNEGQSV